MTYTSAPGSKVSLAKIESFVHLLEEKSLAAEAFFIEDLTMVVPSCHHLHIVILGELTGSGSISKCHLIGVF